MKAVIFAGGFGTRLSEETSIRPKPMVEVGGQPILWHIMKIYSAYGIDEFIICCGYKGYIIKEYFANYFLHRSDVTFNLRYNSMDIHQDEVDPWKVTLIDTGESTLTAGRLKQVQSYIGNETFCLTYGDGVSDIDIGETIKYHHKENCLVTLTAVQPPGRFGTFPLGPDDQRITSFREKPQGDGAWVNGGFFVVEPQVIDDYIKDDGANTMWETVLEAVAPDGQLAAYRHHGFWHPMDTIRDRNTLEKLWASGEAPWKAW
jgi:glucose-1-phosphate cytidylyltransferase